MSSLNYFREPTKEEKDKKQAELKSIQDNIKRVAKLGRDCLDDAKFKKYKDEYIILREKLLSLMKTYADPDPIKDAFFLRACISKIDVFDTMIESIKKDAKKK